MRIYQSKFVQGNKNKMKKLLNSWVSKVLVVSMAFAVIGIQMEVNTAFAASITSASDNMSRLAASTASNHEIKFVTPTGVTSGQTITLTFSADFTGVSGITFNDVDFAIGTTNNCTTATFNEATLAAAPSGATWGLASSGSIITLTSGTDTVTADRCIRFEIGTNATTGATGVNQITNGAADDDDTITIGGTFGDTGVIAVDIITDDQVVITATLGPSISFAISDNAIGFGALTLGASRYADGTGAGSASEVDAHTLTAATNATSGYVIYVVGPTLTSGGNDINAIGGVNTAPAPGTEQFGARYTATGGSGTVSAPYAASGFAYDATTVQDQIASASAATDTTTYGARYVANISTGTAAGNYSTTLTYTATASF